MPTSWRSSKSSTTPGIVSASTRLPGERARRGAGVVCSSSSSSSKPMARSSLARARARAWWSMFVTKRSRWPASRSLRDGLGRARERLARDVSTPSTSSRIAAMARESIRVTRSVALPRRRSSCATRARADRAASTRRSRRRASRRCSTSRRRRRCRTAQKRRVVAKAGPVLRAVAQDERSQLRNRELAVERLVEQLRRALRVDSPAPRRRRRRARPSSGGSRTSAVAQRSSACAAAARTRTSWGACRGCR